MSSEPLSLVVSDYGRSVCLHLPNPDDHIQKELRETGTFYELEMLRDIRARLRPGESVIDVGANIGNHTLYCAKVLGVRVHAFEPCFSARQLLEKNVSTNAISDLVELHSCALGRRAGRGRLVLQDPSNLGRACVLPAHDGEIEIRALDEVELGPEPVGVIKIDVEGGEVEVVSGARGLIRAQRPLVYAEAATTEAYLDLMNALEALGYVSWKRFNYTPTYLFVPETRFRARPIS